MGITNSKLMIYTNNKNIRRALFSLALIGFYFMHTISFAQDKAEKHRTYINMEFTQSELNNKIKATLTARIKGERGRKKIADAEIGFYTISDTSDVFLGKTTTDMDGLASLELSKDQIVIANSDGEYMYRAIFGGGEIYDDVSKDIAIKAVNMKISFIEIDSVKTIVVSAHQVEASGEEIPVDEDVIFYVPRQFSMLKIGEVELEDGKGTVDFPVTLPGDSIGNLQIIAIIEESRDFGNVEALGAKDWGKPRPPVIIEERRGLGDTDAPLWMVYTLIVLLSAVWFHYVYIMYVFLAIKRKGKGQELA